MGSGLKAYETRRGAINGAARRLRAATAARPVLILAWLLFIASATLWLPGYNGITGGEGLPLAALYALVAGVAVIGVRGHSESAAGALASALPVLALMATAAVAGALLNEQQEAGVRGEPVYLYFGVALLASWATLLVSTAAVARTRWNGPAGVGLGIFVAVLGYVLLTARFD